MKKLMLLFVCMICAFMLFACNKPAEGGKQGGEEGGNNTPKTEETLDRTLDAKYKGLAKDKKIYVTTVGQADVQAIDSYLFDLDLEEGKDYTLKNFLVASEVEEGAVVLMAIGASKKGLGAAGTDLNAEKERANAFAAKEGITLIVFHLGGEGRRGETSDPIIDIIAPKANLLLVYEEGNKDGKFNTIAKNNNIDLYLYSSLLTVESAFNVLFDK